MKERLTFRAFAAGTLLALGAAGCGGEKVHNTPTPHASPAEKTATEEATPASDSTAPTGQTGKELAASIAKLSQESRGKPTVPMEYCENTNDNPQRMYSASPARIIVNSLCQPPLGEPVGVYKTAEFDKSQKAGVVHDGDVVKALCIEPDGEYTTNVTGDDSGSTTWVKISHDGLTGFVSEVNFAYVDDSKFKEC